MSTELRSALESLVTKLDDWSNAVALAGNDRDRVMNALLATPWRYDLSELRTLPASDYTEIKVALAGLDEEIGDACAQLRVLGMDAAATQVAYVPHYAFHIARDIEAVAKRLPVEPQRRQDARSAPPLSKIALAQRILNSDCARTREVAWERFDLQSDKGSKYTVGLDAPGVDAAMRKRLEAPQKRR